MNQDIRIFSTDIDGTLIGKPDGLARFNETWNRIPKNRRPILCYNSGRLLDDMLSLIKRGGLITPDYIICGVGTLIYDGNRKEAVKSFAEILEEGWNVETAERIVTSLLPVTKQPIVYQSAYKTSWYLENASPEQLQQLEHALDEAGLQTNVVYSSNRDLDILPKYANKGNALKWLVLHLGLQTTQALVAGDTGNDAAMFRKKGMRGIVVGNAQPELHEATVGLPVYRAEDVCADGLLEGLLHYGLIDKISEPPKARRSAKRSDPAIKSDLRHLLDEEGYKTLSEQDHQFLHTAFDKALDGLKRCMTPMGFVACSPSDNTAEGTDANYRSVWARDGSITVIGSLSLQDEEVSQCQRATLETLLNNMSLTGQTPANVSIDSMVPDYSGIGGISSLDSGIWLIIAVFEYCRKRGDLEFLRKHRGRLQKIMDWLSAHDSNNDGLLEIPEAGDWTDLFGRSYNVLYDEVLWYRANISFGRALEMLGEWRMAGDYLRWAGVIKKAILGKFWPTTKKSDLRDPHFADYQSSIGDTHYLIAQVTPFGFDWRCDVYGNILAFLCNVLDIQKAQKAFRFMWGVGVNDPFPVANLYPPVQAGDPGWRDYYIVNLLNLPNHYHNGGIWPFIGAQWTRFIYRLGLKDLAARELVSLAKLNQAGAFGDWEFNEWAHGKTGKPMGKAYQAWSCSEFIYACSELKIVNNQH